MVATKYAYSKGKNLVRSFSAVFSVFFGLFALFCAGTPKLWNPDGASLFVPNTAHADTPHTGGGGDTSGDITGGGCAGACADGSAGSCACTDGGGCGTDGATA